MPVSKVLYETSPTVRIVKSPTGFLITDYQLCEGYLENGCDVF